MPIFVKRSDGTLVTELLDQTVNLTSTSLALIGRGHVKWGEAINNNFVRLLESGASPIAPATPMNGQLWFDSTNILLNLREGSTWVPLATEAWTEAYIASLDYVTGNQPITLSGDVTGAGATSISTTLAATGVGAGTYTKVGVDAKGRVLTGGQISASDVDTALGYAPVRTVDSVGPDGSGNVNIAGQFVKQGGGNLQGANNIYIGWDGNDGVVRVQVDSDDMGAIALQSWVSANFETPSGAEALANAAQQNAENYALATFIRSVNSIHGDGNGNVNVGTVTSVDGTAPDSSGNVNIAGQFVKQGGGNLQGANNIYIGWDANDGVVRLQVDNDDMGGIAFQSWVEQNFETQSGAQALANAAQQNAENYALATFVRSVNSTNIDGNGNVNVGTVKSVNGNGPDGNGNVSLALNAGTVKSVNGNGPDGNGNVSLALNVGTVRSVNGNGPDSNGNVTITVTNTTTNTGGAGTVTSVNGVGPNSSGAVIIPVGTNNIGTVTSVNGVSPNSSGAVTIPVGGSGNAGTVTSVDNVGPDSSGNVNISGQFVKQGGGVNQSNDPIFIGWDGSNLRATVDSSDWGAFSSQGDAQSRANGAQSAAESYAQTVANTAQNNASNFAVAYANGAFTYDANPENGEFFAASKVFPGDSSGATTNTAFQIKFGSGVTNTGVADPVVFDFAFPNNAFLVICSESTAQSAWEQAALAPLCTVYGVNNLTRSGFQVSCERVYNGGTVQRGYGCGFYFIAIGN